jgi:hypothetical protein
MKEMKNFKKNKKNISSIKKEMPHKHRSANEIGAQDETERYNHGQLLDQTRGLTNCADYACTPAQIDQIYESNRNGAVQVLHLGPASREEADTIEVIYSGSIEIPNNRKQFETLTLDNIYPDKYNHVVDNVIRSDKNTFSVPHAPSDHDSVPTLSGFHPAQRS